MKQAYGSSSNPTSLANRFNTILRKAHQLSVVCEIEVCVIYYGADGEWKTWPKREDVEDMAERYKKATKRKKCLNLREFLEKEKGEKQNLKKKYPNLEHYSSQQLSQLIQSLERTLSTLQERLRFVQAQKQRNTNLIHQTQNPPSNFSVINYNHEEAPFSPAASQLNSYQNDLLIQQEELYGVGQNNITNTNFQMQQQEELYGVGQNHISNTNFQMQEQVLYGCGQNNITNTNFQMQQQQMLYGCGQNNITNTNFQMQQQMLCCFDQNMPMRSDITSNLLQDPYLSNTVPLPFSNGFQNFSYGGNMNGGNTYLSQHMF